MRRTERVRRVLEPLEPRVVLAADPIITEFVASNQSTLDDDDGQSSDWIEIYNRGDRPADMSGWHLTDDAEELTRWTFPQVTIHPGEYLVVFASGKNRVEGTELHTNFRLGASGEYLALVRPDGETKASEFVAYPQQYTDVSFGLRMGDAERLLVHRESPAQLLVPTDDSLGARWTRPDFVPDDAWVITTPGGEPIVAGVGYSADASFDGHYLTDVETLMRGRSSGVYLRIPFEVSSVESLPELLLRMKFDDGYLLYLNGHLLDLQNAPLTPAYNSAATRATTNEAATVFDEVDLSLYLDRLQVGENVLAIHGLNASASDNDFLLVPELYTTGISVLDTVPGYFATPTPGAQNLSQYSLGPTIQRPTHDPAEPAVDDALTVTARIDKTLHDLQQVTLVYRVMYENEVSVPMADDGRAPDAAAGDGLFTAVIPAGAGRPGEMIRYYITASDVTGELSRLPRVIDTTGTDRSEEYFGTIVTDPALSDDLPVFHWFTESVSRARGRSGARASVYYDGEFYDNIFVRQRGAATNGTSQKFNFGDDHKFRVNDQIGRVAEININAQGSDPSYLRQSLAFEAFTWVGGESSLSFLMQMRVNGGDDRIGIFIEQVDEDFLIRHGLDPDGALYKMVQRSNLDPVFADVTTGIEKKTQLAEGLSDLRQIVDGLTRPTAEERAASVFDNFNVAQMLNYLAVRSVIMDADDVRKNFYVYRDTNGTGQWSIFPWDKDWAFGVTGDGGPHLEHPFFGDEAHRKTNANQWNRLYDAVFNDPVLREMYLRRLRSVMDQVLQPPGTDPNDARFERRVDEMLAQAGELLPRGAVSQAQGSLKSFFPDRRQTLYVEHSIDQLGQGPLRDIIPEFVENASYFVPTDDSLGTGWTGLSDPVNAAQWTIGQAGFGFGDRFGALLRSTVNPSASCGQCTSIYVRIPFEVDRAAAIEQLTLRMKYDDGFVAYLNGTEVARANVNGTASYDTTASSRSNAAAVEFENFNISSFTHLLRDGRNVLAVHSLNSSPTSNDQLLMPVLIEGIVGSSTAAGIPHAQVGNPAIVFGSFDHNPASGNQDEEFIELRNPLPTAVDISGWRLSGGIEHEFPPGTVIAAGGSLFVTPHVPSFLARATSPRGGEGRFVQGNYQGRLSNFGQSVILSAADGEHIATLTTPVTPSDAERFLRISEVYYNPPGQDDATEFVELVNISSGPQSVALDLSRVTLSNRVGQLLTIPDGTTLAPGGRVVLVKDPAAFRGAYPSVDPQWTIGGYNAALANDTDTLTLADAQGNEILTFTYFDHGLWPLSADGEGASLEIVDPLTMPAELWNEPASWRSSVDLYGSPGRAGTVRPPVVINEVLANPAGGGQDAIELFNRSTQSVDLSGWYLSDSADNFRKYAILSGTTLAPGQYLVITASQFNNPQSSMVPFGISDEEDDVWLVAPDANGNPAYLIDDVHFGASRRGQSWGRMPDAEGPPVPLVAPDLGRANQTPYIGPIVISELHSHPAPPSDRAQAAYPAIRAQDLEFIELLNRGQAPIHLSGWQLGGSVTWRFPGETIVAPGESLLVVPFDPDHVDHRGRLAAFRAEYDLDPTTRLVGGFAGELGDGGGWVTLASPGRPLDDDPSQPAMLVEDEVHYDDRSPWPAAADGGGLSLARQTPVMLGNAATSWRATLPSPGRMIGNGDLNGDGQIDATDVDRVCAAIGQGDGQFDWNGDGTVDQSDLSAFVRNVLGSRLGDANVDGVFNSSDLVRVFQTGEYEDAIAANSTWADGDWNCDREFNSRDIVASFQDGGYVHALQRSVGSAPADEPSPTSPASFVGRQTAAAAIRSSMSLTAQRTAATGTHNDPPLKDRPKGQGYGAGRGTRHSAEPRIGTEPPSPPRSIIAGRVGSGDPASGMKGPLTAMGVEDAAGCFRMDSSAEDELLPARSSYHRP